MATPITGFDFPIRFSADGHISRAAYDRKLLANMKNIVLTTLTTRVMRPAFGLAITGSLFSKLDNIDLEDARVEIKDAIRIFEPRVTVNSVTLIRDYDTSSIKVTISYQANNLGFSVSRTETFGV
jgi:phage baseplate assembly protein W